MINFVSANSIDGLPNVASDLSSAFHEQLKAFNDDGPPSFAQRQINLKKLLSAIDLWEERIIKAIAMDFSCNGLGGRSSHETIMAEIIIAKGDLKYTLKHLKKWMKVKRVSTALHFQPARSEIRMQPLGVVGIISPWNYPFQLAIVPFIAALAAGNRVMIKPSEYTPATSELLREMLQGIYGSETVYVAIGGVEVAAEFSRLPFHHIFFTGSTVVGKIVARAAAENLTPVTLELGGKSPAIIDESADLDLTSKRLAAGKLINSGQTCIAADYVLMPEGKILNFVDKIIMAAEELYPTVAGNSDYTSIISDRHYSRQLDLIEDARQKGAKIVTAGLDSANDLAASRKVPFTVILGVTPDMRVMQEEIFGPILPVLSCDTPEMAIDFVNKDERPLALYWFGENKKNREKILNGTVSGGVTINDTLWHLAQENLPFGGVGASGMGAYHGDYGFKTFSHARAVFHQSKYSTGKLLYPPYTQLADRILWLLKKIV